MDFETLDRSLYNWLRLKLVAANLTVDIFAYPPGSETTYTAAQMALKNSNGFDEVVELYGVGRTETRGPKAGGKITINRKEEHPGSIGGSPAEAYLTYYDGGILKYKRVREQDQSYDVIYEIRTTTARTVTDRAVQMALDTAFGVRRYIPHWNSATETFSTEESDYLFVDLMRNLELPKDEFNARSILIKVCDVFINTREVIEEGIVPLTQVRLTVNGVGSMGLPPLPDDGCNLPGMSCEALNAPITGLTYPQLINCILPRLDFSDVTTQARVSLGQRNALRDWLGLTTVDECDTIIRINDEPPYQS